MRLTSFDKNGRPALGFRVGDDIVDLETADAGLPRDLLGFLRAGPDAFDRAATVAAKAGRDLRTPFEKLKFHPPIVNAGKIVCLGLNYADHAAEGGHAKPTYPSLYGLEGSRRLAAACIDRALAALDRASISGMLPPLAHWVVGRHS